MFECVREPISIVWQNRQTNKRVFLCCFSVIKTSLSEDSRPNSSLWLTPKSLLFAESSIQGLSKHPKLFLDFGLSRSDTMEIRRIWRRKNERRDGEIRGEEQVHSHTIKVMVRKC